MPNPTSADVHVDRPLTNISIAYLQAAEDFISDRLFPRIPVAKQSDKYFVFDRGDFNRDEMRIRAPGTESAGGGYRLSTDSYYCPVLAFHKDLDDQTLANYDSPLNANREATEYVTHKYLIKKEKDVVSAAWGTSKWATDWTGVASGPTSTQFVFWDAATSDPIADVKRAKSAVKLTGGFRPNVMTISSTVWDALTTNDAILDRIKYGQTAGSPADVTRQTIAALFELDEILVFDTIENTANEPLTESNSFIAADGVLLTYRPRNPGLMTPSAGYTFGWTGLIGGEVASARIKNIPLPQINSDRIEIDATYDQKIVSSDLGIYFTTPLSTS